MTNDELFVLYKRVQNKDRAAEDKLIAEHKKRFPRNPINKNARFGNPDYRTDLHTIYLHLTR